MVEMVGFPTIDSKIIQKILHKRWNLFMKNFLNYPLECGWSCFQAKYHYYNDKYSPFYNKGCFPLIVWMHTYLIISAETIHKTIDLMSSDCIENTIYEW